MTNDLVDVWVIKGSKWLLVTMTRKEFAISEIRMQPFFVLSPL